MFNIIDRDGKTVASATTKTEIEIIFTSLLWTQGQVIERTGKANRRTKGDRRGLPKGTLRGLTIQEG